MILLAITTAGGESGKLRGTGTLVIPNGILGAVLISTDSSNAAVVTVQKDDSNGEKVFDISTIAPAFISGPVSLKGTTKAYYSVTGTGADAMFYEWVE